MWSIYIYGFSLNLFFHRHFSISFLVVIITYHRIPDLIGDDVKRKNNFISKKACTNTIKFQAEATKWIYGWELREGEREEERQRERERKGETGKTTTFMGKFTYPTRNIIFFSISCCVFSFSFPFSIFIHPLLPVKLTQTLILWWK